MFEYPEIRTLGRQMGEALTGRRVVDADRGTAQHAWVFGNTTNALLAERLVGRTVVAAEAAAKVVIVALDSGDGLLIGDLGGRVTLHDAGATLPARHHLRLGFDDDRTLTVAVQGWGFLHLDRLETLQAQAVAAGIDPLEELTPNAYAQIVAESGDRLKESVKAFIVQRPRIAGTGNGYLHDILFRAGLHPRRKLAEVTDDDHRRLREALVLTMRLACEADGRDTERDLFGRPGRYRPLLDQRAKDKPCWTCGTIIEKFSFLGGSCYVCPACQR